MKAQRIKVDKKSMKVIGMSSICLLQDLLLEMDKKENPKGVVLVLLLIAEQWSKLEDLHIEIYNENPEAAKYHMWLDSIVKEKEYLIKELMARFDEWKEEQGESEEETREPQVDYMDRD